MIPILFETTETAFTSNGIGRLTEAISCEVEEERNGVYELTLEYPMTGRLYGEISEGRFIYSRHSDALDAQPFRIYKITKPMSGIITVHAHHRSYDLNHVIVRPFTAGSAAEAMQRISLNTLNACPFTFWTDKSVTADFSLKVPASIRGILGGTEGSILDVYGKGEYEWDNATVKLHLKRGTDTGVTIMYGKNLTDINEESTAENLVSAVAPFWKDAEGENVVVLPEGILTLAGASSENALPLDLSDKFDEAPTVEGLRSKANTWLTNNGKLEPESNIRLSFAQLWQTEEYKSYALLQRVNLCDTVTVIYPALGVKAKTKVIRVVYDALLERYTKMELGEPKSTLSGTLARQEETVRQIVRSFQYPTISQVNAAVNTATKLITGGMGGHVVIGTNANGQPNEILIMDTDDIDTAVNVIRMNANGIGFSTTGYNGPFNTAWTIDGAFVADFITSGTLDANLIRAGIIMDKAGKNYWNLETGEISIDASAIGEDYVTSSQLEVTKNGIMVSVSQTYVTKGNAVSSVATQYYSSTSPDSPQGGSWQDTVPDWQDGRYIFEKTVTMTADGQSEEKIVCISGATGATGERGPGIYKVTTEPSSFETETGGFTPTYRIALATVKIQSGVSDVFVGDVIEYDVYHYPVGYVDASYVYLGARTSIKGADGLPATAYTLIVSHAAIAKSASGTFSPTSITLTAKSQTGTNAYANYSGRFKIEVYNGSSWSTKYTSGSNENTKSYTIPSGTTQVRCSLYLAGGTSTLLDQQTVPVVSDGTSVTITSKSVKYQKGTSGTTAPTGTWGDSIPSNIGENEYLWTQTIVNYSDGNSTEAYSVSRNAANGFSPTVSSTTVEYVESTSGTAHPTSGWSTTPPTTMTAGRYMWTKTTVTYDDGNTSESYAVSRNGSNGGDAYTVILDNESHTFAGGTSAAIAGAATVNVYAYKGATAIAPTVTKANISGLPTGMSVQSVTNDSTNKKSTIVFAVTTSMVTRSGMVTIPVVADGKTFNKEFSYSLALQGTKGDKGDTGKSLTGITEYYARNNSTTAPADSAFNTSVLTPTASEKYVWNYEQLSWNDNGTTSTTKTTKHIIAVYGDKGETGDKGNTGKSLTNVTEYYAVNNSTTAPADSSFSTTVAAPTSSNKYLWNYELLTWDDNGTTSTTKTDKHIAAVYGDKGDKGDTGEKGDKGDRGATWYAGTGITGTSTTAKVFSGSGVSSAMVGDHYLNTSTQNVYRCTVAGAASTAKWVYEQNIKGEQGIQGIQGNKGDPGDTYYFHIKYSNDGGTTFTGNSGEDTGSYIGTYADTVEADSVDVGDYDWVKIEGTDGRNGADHNLLMDVYASSLTKVDGPANRYLSESGNSTTTGEFIAEANLPDPNATHFYRISATQAGKNRGLCWYKGTNPPIISGSTYRMGCYARASSGSPKMNLQFSNNSANQKFFTVSNTDWQWFEYTAIFEDSGSTSDTYKRTYFYCNPQAAGDALDMCGFRLERVTDDVLAIKLTADTAKADAATAQSTADGAAALAQAAKTSADGKITTFYQNTAPTAAAVGDLWINTTNNQNALSRWNGTTWVPVDNKDLSTALQNAATAQATADGKIMTFAQNSQPTATDTGDLWVDTDDNNRLYRWNGTTWDEVTDKTNLVPNLTPWFDRPITDTYDATTNPNAYWGSATTVSTLTQLPDGWAHFEGTNEQESGNVLRLRAQGSAVNSVVANGNYTCLIEFRNVVNAAGIYNFYTQEVTGAQIWGNSGKDGFAINSSQIVDGAKIYKAVSSTLGPTKAASMRWLMSIASYIKPSQTVSFDFRVSLYEGTYTGPYKPYVDQELRADVDDAQTAANNAQTTADRKKQTFITTPTTPYYVGDIYFVDNKLLVCHTERLTGSYTADDWSEDLGYASSDTVATLEASTKTELDTIRSEASANYTSLSDSLDKIQASFNTQVEQTSEDFSIRINGLLESLASLANDTSTKFAEYSKYFRFTADGLEIGEESNALTLVLDNDKISFRRNGVEFSYWDGSDNSFHVGDIIVDVNQVARFGSFGLVPLEGGDLAWKWLGGST